MISFLCHPVIAPIKAQLCDKYLCCILISGEVVRSLAFHLYGREFHFRYEPLEPTESRVSPSGTPVSSHRKSRLGGLGNTGPQSLPRAACYLTLHIMPLRQS